MDILANIEAASVAGNHLKQYMAAASRLAALGNNQNADNGPTSNFAEIGAALQALINPLGPLANVAPQLSSSSSSPFPNLDPLLMAAAAFSTPGRSSAFGIPAPPPPGMLSHHPPLFHDFLAQNGGREECSAELKEQLGQEEDQRVAPTLSNLLATANCTTPKRHRDRSPPKSGMAKRSRLSFPAAKTEQKYVASAIEQNHHSSDNSTTIASGDPTLLLAPSSLLSALTNSTHFPLTAASPPALPSPSGAPRGASITRKSEPEAVLAASSRRLSAMSASSSSSGSTAAGLALVGMPRTPQRKPAEPIPAEKKDQAYYERRRKNNDAAKRSRDTRRMKEELTAQRANYLEQENIQLRAQLGLLRAEIAKYQAMLLNASPSSGGPSIPLPNALVGATPVKMPEGNNPSNTLVLASPTSTTMNDGGGGTTAADTAPVAEEINKVDERTSASTGRPSDALGENRL